MSKSERPAIEPCGCGIEHPRSIKLIRTRTNKKSKRFFLAVPCGTWVSGCSMITWPAAGMVRGPAVRCIWRLATWCPTGELVRLRGFLPKPPSRAALDGLPPAPILIHRGLAHLLGTSDTKHPCCFFSKKISLPFGVVRVRISYSRSGPHLGSL
jgi:hypothetical protein